jgi:hypothetical protein
VIGFEEKGEAHGHGVLVGPRPFRWQSACSRLVVTSGSKKGCRSWMRRGGLGHRTGTVTGLDTALGTITEPKGS